MPADPLPNSGPSENQNLVEACENAAQLVSYLSSTGNLPDDLSTAEFFGILEKARKENLSAEEQHIFWNGYSRLAQHAKPTQIEALQFRNYILGRRKVDSATEREYLTNLRSIQKIRIYSIVSFVFTLLFLTYVSITSNYLVSNQILNKERILIESKIYDGTRLEGVLERNYKNPLSVGDVGGSEGGSEGSTTGSNDQVNSRQLDEEPALFQIQRGEALNAIIQHVEYNLGALQFFQAYTARETVTSSDADQTKYASYREGLNQRTKIEAHQKLINQLISSYFLPVFTSLLGVTVFILRRTSSSLNSGQYRLYESGTYSYRLTLGIVGGIVISWFTTTDNSGIVSSLTPAALAFVIGYSIEILYNLLDSVVKALGASENDQK